MGQQERHHPYRAATRACSRGQAERMELPATTLACQATDTGGRSDREAVNETERFAFAFEGMAPQKHWYKTLSPIFNLLKLKGKVWAIGNGQLTAERGGKSVAPRPAQMLHFFLPDGGLIGHSANQRIF